MKKILAMLLTGAMVLSVPTAAFAGEEAGFDEYELGVEGEQEVDGGGIRTGRIGIVPVGRCRWRHVVVVVRHGSVQVLVAVPVVVREGVPDVSGLKPHGTDRVGVGERVVELLCAA